MGLLRGVGVLHAWGGGEFGRAWLRGEVSTPLSINSLRVFCAHAVLGHQRQWRRRAQ